MSNPHWLVVYDPGGGEPYGEGCECGIGEDHTLAEYDQIYGYGNDDEE